MIKGYVYKNWSSEINYLFSNVDLNNEFNLIDINTEEHAHLCYKSVSLQCNCISID